MLRATGLISFSHFWCRKNINILSSDHQDVIAYVQDQMREYVFWINKFNCKYIADECYIECIISHLPKYRSSRSWPAEFNGYNFWGSSLFLILKTQCNFTSIFDIWSNEDAQRFGIIIHQFYAIIKRNISFYFMSWNDRNCNSTWRVQKTS